MVTTQECPFSWTEKHEDLIRASQVLADLKPGQKIRIIDPDRFQIAVEERYWFQRKLSGDGCLPTVNIVCKIIEECFYLSSTIKDSADEKTCEKHASLKNLYPNALQGLNFIAVLYGSEKEKEFEVAHALAKKIHTYDSAARHILGPEASKVPSPTVPCEIPEDQRSLPHKVIVEVALPILAVACSLAECYGTFSTAYGFVAKAIAFDRKEKNGPFKLALELAQLAKSFHVF
jgi:hypothetical protein